jgi:hypothetical protein
MHRLNPISSIDPSFVHIAPSIHFRRAKAMAADSDSESAMDLQDPDLILLFTWTGAQPHHIAKYTSGYAKIFPSSPIMVITTSLNNLLYRSSAKNKRSLIPAILTILSSHLDSNFLIHCFSESGAHKAIQFAKAFLKSTGRRLPISAVCLDTARGTLNHAKKPQACRTPTKGTPALQTLISLLAYTLAPSSWTTYPTDFSPFLSDSNHTCTFNKSRQALNDPRLWDIHSPRCYLFSTTDKFTHPDSVASHARSAEELGARRVILAQFEELKSSSNGEKYWMTVQQTWDASTSTSSPRTNEKTAYTYVTDIEKQAEIHVLVHELPTQRSPVDCTPESSLEPSPEPPFSASSSSYSSDNDDEITNAPPLQQFQRLQRLLHATARQSSASRKTSADGMTVYGPCQGTRAGASALSRFPTSVLRGSAIDLASSGSLASERPTRLLVCISTFIVAFDALHAYAGFGAEGMNE